MLVDRFRVASRISRSISVALTEESANTHEPVQKQQIKQK